jgi:hypothetical protein
MRGVRFALLVVLSIGAACSGVAGGDAVTTATASGEAQTSGVGAGLTADMLSTLSVASLHSPWTVREERERARQRLVDGKIIPAFSASLTSGTEEAWEGAFWATKLLYLRNDLTRDAMTTALLAYPLRSESFGRMALESVYAVYPREFKPDVMAIMSGTTQPKHFAMAADYLVRLAETEAGENPQMTRTICMGLMKARFPNWQNDPILTMLQFHLQHGKAAPLGNRPPLRDLFSGPFRPGYPVVFSLQRGQRSFPGVAIVRDAKGKFVRNPDGSLFHISHLAFSQSDLPGYITNGNTPQGVFTIWRIDTTRNLFIGKTPFLETALPLEVPPATYFHDNILSGTLWTPELYGDILPQSWRGYFPVREAFFAGKAGRSEIIAHGTTIDPEYYVGKPYYPNTPSIGCLTAKEIWSEKDGGALISDQVALLKAYLSTGSIEGFLVVVDIDDNRRPVHLDDILVDVLAAEAVGS